MEAKIWHHSAWIKETDPDLLASDGEYMLVTAGFQILGFKEHHFAPQGYSAVWLLGESHYAVHTFPEEGRTYVEISSCNLDKYQHFLDLLDRETFNA